MIQFQVLEGKKKQGKMGAGAALGDGLVFYATFPIHGMQ